MPTMASKNTLTHTSATARVILKRALRSKPSITLIAAPIINDAYRHETTAYPSVIDRRTDTFRGNFEKVSLGGFAILRLVTKKSSLVRRRAPIYEAQSLIAISTNVDCIDAELATKVIALCA